MNGSIPSRYRLRVKQRRRVVEYQRSTEEHGHRAASRHFGLARRTVRTWFRRWKSAGDLGLVPCYQERRQRRISDRIIDLAHIARLEYRGGSTRTRIRLERMHKIRANAKTFSGSSVISESRSWRRRRSGSRNS